MQLLSGPRRAKCVWVGRDYSGYNRHNRYRFTPRDIRRRSQLGRQIGWPSSAPRRPTTDRVHANQEARTTAAAAQRAETRARGRAEQEWRRRTSRRRSGRRSGRRRTTPRTNGDGDAPRRSAGPRPSRWRPSSATSRVSEFFAKNRHLLGFDNPRKALLTTVKEAVDNSLDACEEAGILPEIWVHIEATGTDRFKVGVQDNGPGILKKQIPLIFGKLLYGSKFHRLRQSRGQQGIGISAAGMYGVQTTGKPVKIISKVGAKKPAHYYEIQIDTKKNEPQILNGRGEGVDIPPGKKGAEAIAKHGIEWVDQPHGTRVTIELQAKFVRGRGSVDEYLEQTAIANPHITLHYIDPDGNARDYPRSADKLPPEPKEIKPHPYGVELGRLIALLHDDAERDGRRSF